MGWNDRLEEWYETSLPVEALVKGQRILEIDDTWLKAADADLQRMAMKAWFLARYCDPAEETPYMSSEGGYIWVHGGPYHPDEELFERFSEKVNDELIDDVVKELVINMGNDWAPIHWEDDYDEQFGIDVEDPKAPASVLERRLNEISEVLTLTGSHGAMVLAEKLAYSNVITAFESYLWETMTYAVENDEQVIKNIVTKFPHFKDQGMKLGQIYDKLDGLPALVKGYLQDTIWHKWDSVATLIIHALGIKPPSFDPFIKPTIKRHDIIHRSGHAKDGTPVTVDRAEIDGLMDAVRSFVNNLESDLLVRYTEKAHAEIAADFENLDEF